MAKRSRHHTRSKPEAEPAIVYPKWEDSPEAAIIRRYVDRVHNPVSGIRAFCVICMGGQVRSIAECSDMTCPLRPFRMGKNTMDSRAGRPRKTKPDSK